MLYLHVVTEDIYVTGLYDLAGDIFNDALYLDTCVDDPVVEFYNGSGAKNARQI